ncbi:C2 domain-containing protein [Dissophora ornata]|nr:C2 domain-containing protein [Dissophora ornata]
MLSRVVMTSSATTTPVTPALQDDDEHITTRMRIFISRARDLVSRDRNGFSDPYVKLTIGGHKFTTDVIHKSLNPVWDAAFDFDLEAQSLPDQASLMFWDKDRWGRDDYLGTVYIPFDPASLWSDSMPRHFDDPKNEAKWFPLKSIPGKFSKVTGEGS